MTGSLRSPGSGRASAGRRRRPLSLTVGLVVVLVCLALAVVGGAVASDAPDGLERVAQDQGLMTSTTQATTTGRPGGEHGWRAAVDDRFGAAATAAIGVLMTLGLGSAAAVLVRRSDRSPVPEADLS